MVIMLLGAATISAITSIIQGENFTDVFIIPAARYIKARLFSKKLAELLNSRRLDELELSYLKECITYWKDWQKIDATIDENNVINEYERNCHSFIISLLVNEGYNVGKLNVNGSWNDFKTRLRSAGVPKERINNLIR